MPGPSHPPRPPIFGAPLRVADPPQRRSSGNPCQGWERDSTRWARVGGKTVAGRVGSRAWTDRGKGPGGALRGGDVGVRLWEDPQRQGAWANCRFPADEEGKDGHGVIERSAVIIGQCTAQTKRRCISYISDASDMQ